MNSWVSGGALDFHLESELLMIIMITLTLYIILTWSSERFFFGHIDWLSAPNS